MPEAISILLAAAAAYLLGSIPSAKLFARLKGRDIFTTGSGNMGTMNALRHVGPLIGVLTLLLDVAKGAAAMLLAGVIAQLVAPDSANAPFLAAAAAAPMAGVGHVWSVFAGFRGGKALAVALGVLLPGYWLIGLLSAVLLGVLALRIKSTNLASIIAVSVALVAVWVSTLAGWTGAAIELAIPCGLIVLVALIVWRHLPLEEAETGTGGATAAARVPR